MYKIKTMKKTALCLFEESGTFKNLFEKEGFNAIAVDIKNGIDILQFNYKELQNVEIIISHPPCTEFAVSGTRWWSSKPPEKLENAIILVKKTLEIIQYFKPRVWFIENPVGRIESCVPEMKQFFKWWFHPHFFANYADNPTAEAYTKKTILWGQFRPPIKNGVKPFICKKTGHSLDYCYKMVNGKEPPKAQRSIIRSKTPQGFARAFVKSNIDYKPAGKQLKLPI